nr:ethylene-responsive transcription factor CRF1-like [Ipomoea batatas]
MARITVTDPDATDTSSDEEKLYERRRKVEKEECQKVEKEECQKVDNEPSVLPQPRQKVENEEY